MLSTPPKVRNPAPVPTPRPPAGSGDASSRPVPGLRWERPVRPMGVVAPYSAAPRCGAREWPDPVRDLTSRVGSEGRHSRPVPQRCSTPAFGVARLAVMKVIGAGLGRTGTSSLRAALELLLGQPCYHMTEAIEHPEHLEF